MNSLVVALWILLWTNLLGAIIFVVMILRKKD